MTTLNALIHESASAQERELAGLGRPSLHARAHRKRVVRHARVATGAALGVGALAIGATLAVPAVWPHDTTAIGALAPAGRAELPLAADGSLMTSIPANTVVVDVYLDAMCPVCAQFSQLYDADLRAIERATVVYHPISILDRASSDGSYSTRAASAIQEVAAGSPDRLGAFLDQLWAHQPVENSGTLTDAELTQLALDAGVPTDVASLFSQHRYADAVAKATQAAVDAGLQGVPTIYIDGTMYESTSSPTWGTLVLKIQLAVAERQRQGLKATLATSQDGVSAPATASAPALESIGASASANAPATVGANAPSSSDPSASQAP